MSGKDSLPGKVPLRQVVQVITDAAYSRISAAARTEHELTRGNIERTVKEGVAAMRSVGLYFTTTPSVGTSQIELRNRAVGAEVANFVDRLDPNTPREQGRILCELATQESSRGLDALAEAGIYLGVRQ